MNLHSALKTSYLGLKAKKSRSILTILGIVIGITAIILIMSLGQGAQNLIIGQVQSIGSKTIAVVPGKQIKGPSDFAQMASDSLKEKDLDALKKKENVPNLAKIMPIVFGTQTGSYGSETYNFSVFGATELIQSIYDLEMQSGYFFTEDDIKSNANVVVIGDKIKQELFGLDNPVGQKMKIKGSNYRVIGVIKQKGAGSLVNFDDIAMMPYTTVQQYLLGIKYFNRIIIEADKEENVNQTVYDIKQTIRESHNITDPAKDDFNVETQADAIKTLSVITNVLTYFLAAVAAISLVVGGIGIMNIMLVSVTERTKEIGLRKAIGATNKDILLQFLLESILLTIVGGAIGIFLGASFSFLTSLILSRALALNWSFVFPIGGAILGLGVSAFIGLVFELYPAMQAARKSPIEALRYE